MSVSGRPRPSRRGTAGAAPAESLTGGTDDLPESERGDRGDGSGGRCRGPARLRRRVRRGPGRGGHRGGGEAERGGAAGGGSAAPALAHAVAATEEAERTLRAEIQTAAPKLAFALVETLLGRELALAADPGREAITRVLALDEGMQPATVRLNPADVAAFDDAISAGSSTWWPTRQSSRVGRWSRSGGPSLTGSWHRRSSGCARSSSVREQMMTALLDALAEPALSAARPRRYGQVTQMVGMSIEVAGIPAAIGDGLVLLPGERPDRWPRSSRCATRGSCAWRSGRRAGLRAGNPRDGHGRPVARAGRSRLCWVAVLDGIGRPLDEGPAIAGCDVSVRGAPPHPLRRGMVADQLPLGVRVLDGLIPCGKGQRLGIFAGFGRREVVTDVDDRPGNVRRRLGGGADRRTGA